MAINQPSDARLIELGYEPVAVAGKRALGHAWSTRPNTIEAVAAERAALPAAVSTGLRTGALVGVDIDVLDPAHVERFKQLALDALGQTPLVRVGSKGAMLCYRNDVPIGKITIATKEWVRENGKSVNRGPKIEVLGTGQQFAAYGIHPDTGRSYTWINTDPDLDFTWEPLVLPFAHLPEVTPDQLRAFADHAATLFAELRYSDVSVSDPGDPTKRIAREAKRREDKVPVTIAELREVLSYIDPECDRSRERWIACLGGIQATNLRDVAAEDMDAALVEIAQDWSRGDLTGSRPANWDGDADVAATYYSLDPMKPYGSSYGTLDHAARQNGYTKPPPQPTDEETFRSVSPAYMGDPAAAVMPPSIMAPQVRLRSGVGVRARNVEWLWPGYIARGKYQAFAGGKGAGKSSIVFDLGARLSVGGKWPDGSTAPLGDFLVWSGEDDFEDTILPRFLMAGGNPARVHHVEDIVANGETRPFDPARDIPALITAAQQFPNLGLIMIDPVVSAVAGDSHKNAETRRGLQPLVDLASKCGAGLLGITHFTKGTQGRDPIERFTGSLAFGALARIALGAVKGTDENAPRRLVRVASNIGPMGGGFEYLLRRDLLPGYDFEAQRVVWGKQLTGDARTLLDQVEGESAGLKAIRFLENILCENGGTMMTAQLKEAATAYGFSWRTMERAKEEMGNRIGVGQNVGAKSGGWYWRLTDPKVLYPNAAE